MITYRSSIVKDFPGLELMNPESCRGDQVIRLSQIAFLPKFFHIQPVKFLKNIQKAYFGVIDPIDGRVVNDNGQSGLSIENGIHRLLVFYLLCGDQYLALRSRAEIPLPQKSAFEELRGVIKRHRLVELAKREMDHIDLAEMTLRDSVKNFGLFIGAYNFSRGVYYNSRLTDYLRGDRNRPCVLTSDHRARLDSFQ